MLEIYDFSTMDLTQHNSVVDVQEYDTHDFWSEIHHPSRKRAYLKYVDSIKDDSISARQLHQNKGANQQKKWFEGRWFS